MCYHLYVQASTVDPLNRKNVVEITYLEEALEFVVNENDVIELTVVREAFGLPLIVYETAYVLYAVATQLS
jgi:hypothetical protein